MSVHKIYRDEGAPPVYRQVSVALRRDIQHFYKAGDALPPEHELAARYNINRHTLRRAIDELVNDGLVTRQHGKGVFVLTPVIDYAIGTRTRFTETLEAQGAKTQSRVTRKQIIPAQGGVADKLQLEIGEKVIFIETLREVDGKPFCVLSHFLPLNLCQKVFDEYERDSLHSFLESACGMQLKRQQSLISAVMPQADDAIALSMPRNMPVLRVKSLNVDIQNNRPIEYVVTRFRGDGAQLTIQPH
jgi:GntR family phosphonate transport system transcriptional regulator